MPQQRIQQCLAEGMSIIVASVDSRGMPSCCRGLALKSDDELATATVYVPMAVSRTVIADVATTGRIAVASTYPIDNSSIQLKGRTRTARVAREDEASFVRHRFNAFGDVLETLGIPPAVSSRAPVWPAFAIDLTVEEIYDQTPGPRAGTRLR
jgi:hypothetical protein